MRAFLMPKEGTERWEITDHRQSGMSLKKGDLEILEILIIEYIHIYGGIFPKESDKTAEPLGTRVFTVRRRFCRYCLSPTKQITTKLVFVVSDHYGFVVISVFCRLYLQLTELRESRHEPLSTSLCLIEKIKKQMDGFRGPP